MSLFVLLAAASCAARSQFNTAGNQMQDLNETRRVLVAEGKSKPRTKVALSIVESGETKQIEKSQHFRNVVAIVENGGSVCTGTYVQSIIGSPPGLPKLEGSLISDDHFVVTAAHCLYQQKYTDKTTGENGETIKTPVPGHWFFPDPNGNIKVAFPLSKNPISDNTLIGVTAAYIPKIWTTPEGKKHRWKHDYALLKLATAPPTYPSNFVISEIRPDADFFRWAGYGGTFQLDTARLEPLPAEGEFTTQRARTAAGVSKFMTDNAAELGSGSRGQNLAEALLLTPVAQEQKGDSGSPFFRKVKDSRRCRVQAVMHGGWPVKEDTEVKVVTASKFDSAAIATIKEMMKGQGTSFDVRPVPGDVAHEGFYDDYLQYEEALENLEWAKDEFAISSRLLEMERKERSVRDIWRLKSMQ